MNTDTYSLLTWCWRPGWYLHAWACHPEPALASLGYYSGWEWECTLYRMWSWMTPGHWKEMKSSQFNLTDAVALVYSTEWIQKVVAHSASSWATGHLYWAVLNRQMSAYCRTEERKRSYPWPLKVNQSTRQNTCKRCGEHLAWYFDSFHSLGWVVGDVNIHADGLSMIIQLYKKNKHLRPVDFYIFLNVFSASILILKHMKKKRKVLVSERVFFRDYMTTCRSQQPIRRERMHQSVKKWM